MEYDHRIDEAIISTLEAEEKASFNELLNEIKECYKPITSKRLSIHLERLEKEEGVIIRRSQLKKYQNQERIVEYVNDRLIGVRRYCFLTEAAKFERKLEIFEGVVSKREERSKRDKQNDKEESQAQKRKKLLLLVLLLGSMGATRSRPKSKAELGDIGLYDEKERRLVPYELYTVPGFGVSDLLDEKNKRFLGQAGALSYVKFSKTELNEFFETLISQDPPMIKIIDEIDGEKRYGLEDRRFGDFLSDCWYLFFFVKDGLDARWRYLKRPTSKEYEWYRYFYGNKAAREYFTEVLAEKRSFSEYEDLFRSLGLAHLNSKERKEFFARYGEKRMEDSFNAAGRVLISINSKYKDIIDRYPSSIARLLIEQICSPLFAKPGKALLPPS
jgi:hypothetical protein